MKNVMSKTGRYLMLAVLPAMLAACSDDEENKPEVKLTLTEPISHVTFVSKGSIELPVRISGIETDPEVSDFMVLPTSVSADNIHFDWDQTEPAGDLPMGEIKDLKVSDVREGEDEGSYILTVDYDATGNMSVSYSDVYVFYGDAKSDMAFGLSYEGMSQNAVAMPVQTCKKSELGMRWRIDMTQIYKDLDIKFEDVYINRLHKLYAGIDGDKSLDLDRGSHWENLGVILGTGYYENVDTKVSYINLLNPVSFETGVHYFIQFIIGKGNSEYVAVHVPILITEE